MIELKNILNYINEDLSIKDKERFVLWLDSSNENREEYDFIEKVDNSSKQLNDIELFYLEEEWNIIEDLFVDEKVVNSQSRFLRIVSIAASILFFGFALSFLFNEKPTYNEVTTLNNRDTINLIDGSIVYLSENSYLKYFVKKDKKANKRYVELKGEAIFDVARDENLPFVVKVKGAGIDVLGTVFKIRQLSNVVSVENIEGVINLFEWENASNSLILNKKEKAEFTTGVIKKVIPISYEIEMIGEYHQIEYIIDLLFDKYDASFSTAPYADIQMDQQVFINFDQTLEEILLQLDTTSKIVYNQTCGNCFEISVLKSK